MSKEKIGSNQVRKKYSAEFKDQVLARAEIDGIAQVARNLGIKDSVIYSWRAKNKSWIA